MKIFWIKVKFKINFVELSIRASKSYMFSKIPSERNQCERESSISAIKRTRESRGSSFCSNLIINHNKMVDLKKSNKFENLRVKTSYWDSNKENNRQNFSSKRNTFKNNSKNYKHAFNKRKINLTSKVNVSKESEKRSNLKSYQSSYSQRNSKI